MTRRPPRRGRVPQGRRGRDLGRQQRRARLLTGLAGYSCRHHGGTKLAATSTRTADRRVVLPARLARDHDPQLHIHNLVPTAQGPTVSGARLDGRAVSSAAGGRCGRGAHDQERVTRMARDAVQDPRGRQGLRDVGVWRRRWG
ncbi:hypothetical protein HBB16_06405 [Pseudonocardia sp. MCCB 268]|nr:hypothetical protein [Pseudonocardia cytotoxica]